MKYLNEDYIFKTNPQIRGKIAYFDLVVNNFIPNPNSELYLAAHVKKDFLEHWMICDVFVYRWGDKKREHRLKRNIIGYSGLLGRQIRLHKNNFLDFYFSDRDIKPGSKYQLIILICPRLIECEESEYIFDKTSIKNLESLINEDMIVIKTHLWDIQKEGKN